MSDSSKQTGDDLSGGAMPVRAEKRTQGAVERLWKQFFGPKTTERAILPLLEALSTKLPHLQPMKVEKEEPVRDTVPVEANMWELKALINWHQKIYDGIPREHYHKMTKAGCTLEVTANNHLTRVRELTALLERTWD